ncbi:MAG: hypothetical protein J0L97_00865 [Alphaproteobacteria bacterium]|nr:hypothetical protein [Alphaproteobacteria bacterium]
MASPGFHNLTESRDAILAAYERGCLYLHMLEFTPGKEVARISFFDVMAGVRDAAYDAMCHENVRPFRNAFPGLPATALKRGFPVSFFDYFSRVGLLLDGNAAGDADPVLVSSSDACSVRTWREGAQVMTYREEAVSHFTFLRGMQEKDIAVVGTMRVEEFTALHIAAARQALDGFWAALAAMGWEHYTAQQNAFPGMNEVDLLARLQGVKGVAACSTSKSGMARRVSGVAQAAALAEWLQTRYPDIFPESPPVFSYHLSRRHAELHALTPEEIADPLLYFHQHGGAQPDSERRGR